MPNSRIKTGIISFLVIVFVFYLIFLEAQIHSMSRQLDALNNMIVELRSDIARAAAPPPPPASAVEQWCFSPSKGSPQCYVTEQDCSAALAVHPDADVGSRCAVEHRASTTAPTQPVPRKP
jgi:hypothetical protein